MKISSSRVELPAANCIKARQATGHSCIEAGGSDEEADNDQVLCGLPVHLPLSSVDGGRGVAMDCQPCPAALDPVTLRARQGPQA